VPTREDVLAIKCIEDAIDHHTDTVMPREVGLVRTALAEDLILFTEHAVDEADDEGIPQDAVWRVIETTKHISKDRNASERRQVGLNFQGPLPDRRRIEVKVSWDDGYYIATVYTV
jgi:hypothetical protein